jgi:GNAT superfamily N-acetyltransferase
MSSPVIIEQIQDKRGMTEFVKFPFALYRGDPNWVPPLIEERLDVFNPKKNPIFEHAHCQAFLARRDGKPVGTISAMINDRHNEVHNERMGSFGFFETINDAEVATALLRAAEGWVKDQGMTVIRGPLNLSMNDEVGTLIDGFDEPPMIMMTYNPRYYPGLIEANGYGKAMDLYAWVFNDMKQGLADAPDKLERVARKVMQKQNLHIRKVDMKNFDRDVALVKQVYNAAWQRNWGFTPMTDHEIDHLAAGLKAMIDPNLVFIAETDEGKPVGVALSLPDLHQALKRSGGGHYFPFGLLKFIWHRRHINQARLMIMGMVEEYRGWGTDSVFYLETAREAVKRGYTRMEGSWILETNTMMNQIIERLGGMRYKTYRVYEKKL